MKRTIVAAAMERATESTTEKAKAVVTLIETERKRL